MRMSPLKRKIVDEYHKMTRQLFVGKTVDYDYILDMITFTEIGSLSCNPELIQNHFLNK